MAGRESAPFAGCGTLNCARLTVIVAVVVVGALEAAGRAGCAVGRCRTWTVGWPTLNVNVFERCSLCASLISSLLASSMHSERGKWGGMGKGVREREGV